MQSRDRTNPSKESNYYTKKRFVTWYSKGMSDYCFEHYRMINNWSCKHIIYGIYDEESEEEEDV